MSVAVPKRQAKDPINFDIILVCRKSESIPTDPLPFDTALEIAAKRSRLQIREFHNDGQCLSSNDLRVILLSNLLVSLSAGRDAQKVTTLFKESQKQVDREVVKLTQVQ